MAVLGLLVVAVGCTGDHGPDRWSGRPVTVPGVDVVAVEAQTCERPHTRRGVATFVADDVVLTAAHVVEGRLRRLEIGGRPGHVIALDQRLDLALVALGDHLREVAAPPEWYPDLVGSPVAPDTVEVRSAAGSIEATMTRSLVLRVDDLSAGVLHERPAVELDVVVETGISGSPVVDRAGRIIAVVVLRRAGTGVSYATPVPDLDELHRAASLALPDTCV